MKSSHTLVAAACALMFGVVGAQGASISLYNTGVSVANNADGTNTTASPTTAFVTAANWTITGPSGPGNALTVGTSQVNYKADDGSSAWVNQFGTAGITEPSGDYFFTTTFNILGGFDPSTASILGEFGADDAVTDIQLNGVSVFGYPASPGFGGATLFLPLAIPLGSNFVSGANTLTFRVNNNPGGNFTNPVALNVGMLRGTVFAPEPASLAVLSLSSIFLLRRRRSV